MDGDVINTDTNIGVEAIRYFEHQFTEDHYPKNYDILSCIPYLITPTENKVTTFLPSKDEVKGVVFSLGADSVGGPDGFNGAFYNHY